MIKFAIPALIILSGCEAAQKPGKLMQCEVIATGETFSYLSDKTVAGDHGVTITETDGSVRRVSATDLKGIRCEEVAPPLATAGAG